MTLPHDIEALAGNLTQAGKQALLGATMCDDGGARLTCTSLWSATINALERRKLVQFNCLTPTGLLLRAHLQSQSQESRDG